MRVRPVFLRFAGAGVLIGLGIFGLSVFGPEKGVEMSPQWSVLYNLCGLLCVAGFVGFVTQIFWYLFWSLVSAVLTRLRARTVARGEGG